MTGSGLKATMTTFRALEKAILSKEQLAAFQSSNTYAKITSYIEALNNAVVGCKLTDECSQSQVRRGPLWHFCVFFACFTGQVAYRSGGFVRLLGNRGADRGAGSRGGAGEGDAAG